MSMSLKIGNTIVYLPFLLAVIGDEYECVYQIVLQIYFLLRVLIHTSSVPN